MLESKLGKWTMPLFRKIGHIYFPQKKDDRVLSAKSELIKQHRGFHHPAAKRFQNLLKKAKPKDLDTDTLNMPECNREACNTCRRFGPKPLTLGASMPPEKLVFGDDFSLDLMWIEG